MTETEWATENPAPSKKLVPTWLWFCGGGCLLAVILGVVGVMWGVGMAKKAVDPEVQYGKLEELIEMDERPEDWTLAFGWGLGVDMWMFQDSRGYMVIIMHFDEGEADEVRNQILNPEFAGGLGGMGDRKEMSLSSITIQGREIEMMTYVQLAGGQAGSATGQAAAIDITPAGGGGLIFMMLTRVSSGDEITLEEVTEVLAPFHIGPDR